LIEEFQKGQILELKYKNKIHLAVFKGKEIRIDRANSECYVFHIHTSRGIKEEAFINIPTYKEPSTRTINFFKNKLLNLFEGVNSIGMVLEQLGKITQGK